MYKGVIDASALLAFLKAESLFEIDLEALLPYSLVFAVNAYEVATVMRRLKMPSDLIETTICNTRNHSF